MPEKSAPTNDKAASKIALLRDVLRFCDADRLARQLGLRSAAAADALRSNEAALDHLAMRFAEGCDDLSAEEAASSAHRLLRTGEEHATILGEAGHA